MCFQGLIATTFIILAAKDLSHAGAATQKMFPFVSIIYHRIGESGPGNQALAARIFRRLHLRLRFLWPAGTNLSWESVSGR